MTLSRTPFLQRSEFLKDSPTFIRTLKIIHMVNHDYLFKILSNSFEKFCTKYGIEPMSADEMYPLAEDEVTGISADDANSWLRRFLFVYNKFESTYWDKHQYCSNLEFARVREDAGLGVFFAVNPLLFG